MHSAADFSRVNPCRKKPVKTQPLPPSQSQLWHCTSKQVSKVKVLKRVWQTACKSMAPYVQGRPWQVHPKEVVLPAGCPQQIPEKPQTARGTPHTKPPNWQFIPENPSKPQTSTYANPGSVLFLNHSPPHPHSEPFSSTSTLNLQLIQLPIETDHAQDKNGWVQPDGMHAMPKASVTFDEPKNPQQIAQRPIPHKSSAHNLITINILSAALAAFASSVAKNPYSDATDTATDKSQCNAGMLAAGGPDSPCGIISSSKQPSVAN